MLKRLYGLFLGLALLQLTLASAAAVDVAGVKVPEVVRYANQDLHLVGAGLRTRYFFKVYVASLYASERPPTAAALIDSAAPCVITLHLLRDVSASKLSNAMEDGLRANSAIANIPALLPGVEKLVGIMKEVGEAKAGTVVTLGFTPDAVNVAVNGIERGQVVNPGLNRAMLRVWLGEHPVQDSLKRALLGTN